MDTDKFFAKRYIRPRRIEFVQIPVWQRQSAPSQPFPGGEGQSLLEIRKN